MPMGQESGPSASVAWKRYEVEAEQSGTVFLLTLPDASNPTRMTDGIAPVLHVALERPAMPTGPEGWPVFSLIVFLRRKPVAGEAWAPLVEGGQVSLDATLTPPSLVRQALARKTGAECPSIFVREGVFRLVSSAEASGSAATEGEKILAEASIAGSSARASLSARLTAEEALAVEESFVTGAPAGNLVVRGEIRFRVAAEGPRTVRLVGVWARIYDALRVAPSEATTDTSSGGEFSLDGIRAAAAAMLHDGVLRAYDLDAEGEHAIDPPLPDDAFRLFLAQATAAVLDRATPQLPADDPGNRYRLAARRPIEAFTLDAVRRTSPATGLRRLVATAVIGDLLGQARAAGMPLDAAVQFHVLEGGTGPTPGGGGQTGPGSAAPSGPTSPAPRLLRTGRGSPSRSPAQGRAVMLAEANGGARALSAVLQTGARVAAASAAALLVSDAVLVRPTAGGMVRTGVVDDLKVPFGPVQPNDGVESRPVVANAGADPWPDRITAGKNWYAPTFVPAMPDPAAGPEKSPFLYTFERTGVTPSGTVGIRCSLLFTLRRELSSSAKTGSPDPKSIAWTPTNGLSVTLHLPFVDEVSAQPKTAAFPATVQAQPDGSLSCRIELVNQWARLLYGALSRPGFQAQPVRVAVAYTFPAYVPNKRWKPSEVLLLSKEAMVPVARTAAERLEFAGQTHFDLAEGIVRYGGGEFRLSREPPRAAAGERDGARHGDAGPLLASDRGVDAALAARPAADVLAKVESRPVLLRPIETQPPIVFRPPLKPDRLWKDIFIQADYYEQTIVRETSADLLVPCAGFGASYRDRTGGGDVAIGCQDALALGATAYKAYEEIPDLATDRYRVFFSLQQSGRFMVLPARYRVGRGDASAGDRAFAPAIAMFSVLDPDNDARSRLAVEATLEPDIPPFARQELLLALRAHAHSPAIDYPTEFAKDITYVWNLPAGLSIEPQALRVPNGFRVSLGTDFVGALILEKLLCADGVAAAVTFQMPDGTTMPSVIEVGLAAVAGTWGTGPFAVTIENGALRITNRIERPVDLIEVMALTAFETAGPMRVHAEVNLVEGASHTVVLPPRTAEPFPVYSVPLAPPAKLEDIRAVLDRVTQNVLFMDLTNHENHGLARIEVKARIKDVPSEQTVGLSGNPGSGVATMILPFTTFLAKRLLEFKIKKIFSDGRTEDTPWIPWDLDKNGSVVSLTWELIGVAA